MQEALEGIDLSHLSPEDPNDEASHNLWGLLEIEVRRNRQLRRVKDLKKNLDALQNDLRSCRDSNDVISESQMFRVQEALQSNTKNLEDVFRAGERTSSSLEILQVVLSGTLAFEILDRVTGGWSVVDEYEWAKEYIAKPLMAKPGVWFIINMFMWGLIAFFLTKFMAYLTNTTGVICCRYKANIPIDLDALKTFLSEKEIQEEEIQQENTNVGMSLKKVSWQEEAEPGSTWDKINPQVDLTFDPIHGYLLSVCMTVQRFGLPPHINDKHIGFLFFEELKEADVLSEMPEYLAIAKEEEKKVVDTAKRWGKEKKD